jgi:hypothetical protein
MATVLDRSSPESYSTTRPKVALRLPTSGRHRRVALTLASVVVIAISIASFADIYSSGNHQTSVLMVTSTIPQGQPVEAGQLGQVAISVSGGIAPIPVSDASELSGKRAAVTIPAGSLLTAGDVTDAAAIADGDAVVGLALKAGQVPSAGVDPGDRVMIVQTGESATAVVSSGASSPTSPSSAASSGVLVPEASVFGVDQPPAGSAADASLLVSVEVSSTSAAAVSTAADADQISLVLLPPDAGGSGGSGGATASGGTP